jgi:hypothetical protein
MAGQMGADLRRYLVGRTGFEPVTSSVSVQGSYLAGSHDLGIRGSGGRSRRVVVRRRCCHFCCHRPSGCRWVMSTTTYVSLVSGVPACLADQVKASLGVAAVAASPLSRPVSSAIPLAVARSGVRFLDLSPLTRGPAACEAHPECRC